MGNTRKVRLEFTLVGKSYETGEKVNDIPASEIHENVLRKIQNSFGERPVFISEKSSNIITRGGKYPDFFIAGWFVSSSATGEPTGKYLGSDLGSELLVIAHGESMVGAKRSLMSTVTDVPWDLVARNI